MQVERVRLEWGTPEVGISDHVWTCEEIAALLD
jgi:hypothetical protein